ncbi:DNA-(apurinic or apyrimidinic site) lyase [Rubritalea squalenifaciens DSM 18772]|uniref:Formamidopyrimidine-DNA glycosylase n=2 Tax=Rubritalea TaxID=361050 RepID=A0A1M6HZM3_9BACT|nr:bifunctional DNA-formamidopyrimidine glycosylase/DNA-(apurinic or apyrimidinic site) lyase [Rubritalea squalenifaciens]SHJ27682.1 DNA-(apurinic or apyrimidinic site) lyase [Rubritalea squalenifaciens DSM 18772]
MPELPEVETTCRGISPFLTNKTISRVDVREERLRWPVSPEICSATGLVITQVRRRAKYIILDTQSGGHILIHLGMSGSLRICGADSDIRKHDHVIFHLPDELELRYHDPRRFGCILWVEGNVESHPLLKDLGPEPLSEEFSADYLYASTRGRNTAIKLHIMNNHHVVGVGNIYACESLFMSGIHPTRSAGRISKSRLTKLHQAIQTVLERSITQGGTTLRDFVNSDGQPGYFKQQLEVYDREGEPCRQCGAAIKRIVLGQRSTFYCPKCQR